MLDIKFIRENPDLIKEAARKKKIDFDVQKLIEVDEKRRQVLLSVEKKRTEQNDVSKKITSARPEEKAMLITEMQKVKAEMQKEEEQLKEIMKEWQILMVQVPNVPDISVPEGESDKDNAEVRTWGEAPKFDFIPKNHIELMEGLDMVDFERAQK
jgi:seryl-tRNA synthetase